MSKDVSVEWRDDGEVIITKHRDTPEARETVEALRRAIEFFNKNDPEFTAGAYDPPPGDGDEEEGDEDKTETELSPRERARRQRQLAENVRETGQLEATKLLKGHTPMTDPDTLIAEIGKRQGLGLAVVKRFVENGTDELTEHQIVSLATSDLGGAAAFAKRYQGDDALGRMLREACAKARDAAWFAPTVLATGGRALATAVKPGAGKGDPLCEQIVADKRTAAPWMSEEELNRYAAAMAAEIDRVTRGKQERARPGTLENV
jgi:hypothetical protein